MNAIYYMYLQENGEFTLRILQLLAKDLSLKEFSKQIKLLTRTKEK